MGEDKEIEGGVGTGLRSLLEEAEQSSDLEKTEGLGIGRPTFVCWLHHFLAI